MTTKVTSGLISADAALVDLNIDANTLYIDASENKVGIGTTTPTEKITANGALAVTGAVASNPGNSGTLSYDLTSFTTELSSYANDATANGNIAFRTGYGGATPTTKAIITGSGDVGIGTTNPSQRLHVDGGDALIKTSYDANGTTNSRLYFASRASGDWRNSTIGNTGNALVFSTGGTGTTHTNATERMRILSDGNIGVGTTTPGSKKLKIVGSASAYPLSLDSTDTEYALEFQRNGTSEWWLKASASNFHIHENGSSDHLTVSSGGNVGIAQTSPTEKLHVNGVIMSKAQKTESMQMFNIASGTYTAGSWYNFTTRSAIANFGYGSGFYIWHIYDDTYLAGGGNYFINYCSEPFYFANVATNAANTMEFGMNNTVAFGHAANGGAASRVKLRLAEEYGASGANSDIQWAWNGNNNLTIDQNAGRRIYIYLHKIGGN